MFQATVLPQQTVQSFTFVYPPTEKAKSKHSFMSGKAQTLVNKKNSKCESLPLKASIDNELKAGR